MLDTPSHPARPAAVRSQPLSESRRLLAILCTLHKAVRRRSSDARALARCAIAAQGTLGLPDAALPSPLREEYEQSPTPAEWQRLGEALHRRTGRVAGAVSYLETWLPSLTRAAALDADDTAILGLALGYSGCAHTERLWDDLSQNRNRSMLLRNDPELFALMLGLPETRVRHALSAEGRLRDSGLLSADEDGDLTVLYRLSRLLARRVPLEGDVRGMLLSPPRRAELAWESFQHLGEGAELAARLLRGALSASERGVGILLYGPPGTGKTAFAATLADHIGATLHPVGESDSEGEEPTSGERLAELRLSQRLLGDPTSVLLFDEAEDLFSSHGFGDERPRSRVFLHRLLEQGRAPVIWTANDISVLGPAMARRMMLCIEVRQPGVGVRAQLWRDMARAENVALTEADAADLARTVPAAPAILRNALRATRLVGGDSATARRVANDVARVVAGGCLPPPEQAPDADYDAALVRADRDLAQLADLLARPGAPRQVSLLLSGPPGSGKSAFVRYLAVRMEMPVLMKRASDLLSKYVGQSEQRIAAAFAEARDTGSFLVFDEADSLLADRRGAHYSWEVTQVNEMLTWMEDHPLPFACTTNLPEYLDQASLRRFLEKARFGYLTADQAVLAFTRFFGLPAPGALARLKQLTPADFALVRRRAALRDDAACADALVALLEAESAGRDGARPIGFGA